MVALLGEGGEQVLQLVDHVFGGSGSDELNGGPWGDVLIGGGASDGIFPGRGSDLVRGGSGMDYIEMTPDGHRDVIHCGSGYDTVAYWDIVDARDFWDEDCEDIVAVNSPN